jgi:tetratricopeptide (TPR) repeat protein
MNRSTLSLGAFVLAAFVALGVVAGPLAGCNAKSQPTGEAAPVVDTGILAYLSLARAAHHEADILEEQGDVDGAITALERIVHAPRPHPGEAVPEIEETLADAHARLADLRTTKGDLDGAERDVKDGLEHAKEPTYFRGELLTAYGVLEHKRAEKATAAGQTAAANTARDHAVSLLKEAMDIQERVIGKTLGDAGDAGGR